MPRVSVTGSKIISDINITPLTDVMLVLLIIFMVTATFFAAEPAMQVRLPSAVTAESPLDQTNEILVSLSKDGKVAVNCKCIVVDNLVSELVEAARQTPGEKVVRIRADRDVRYGAIIYAMDAARLVGLRNVALATEKETQPPAQSNSQ
jgi:biopolymer transport protein ExbD